MQKDVDDAMAVKGEVEELRAFRDWGEPHIKDL